MRIGSLCTGYGGLEEGIRAVLGGEVAWQSEIDPGACKILAHRYPGIPNIGDMTRIGLPYSDEEWGAMQLVAEWDPENFEWPTPDWSGVEPIDVLCGGTPCQDLSAAGKRAGMTHGTRSNLWVAMREAIAQLRPPLVVWENVRGAYSARADSELESREGRVGVGGDGPVLRALGRVLGDLSSLGYDASWHGLRAADVGAPHGRFRVFVAAWPAADADGVNAGPLAAGDQRWESEVSAGNGGRVAAYPNGSVGGEWRFAAPRQAEGGGAWADAGGRSGAPAAHPEGDGRREGWPEPARPIGGPDAALSGDDTAPDADSAGLGRLEELHAAPKARDGARNRDDTDGLAVAAGGVDWGQYGPAIRRWERRLGRPAPEPTQRGKNGQPRLSPAFVEWMQGLPVGWVTDVPGLTRNEMLKALGNGVVSQQAAVALRLLLPDVAAPPASVETEGAA